MTQTIAYVFGTILTVLGIWGFVQNPVLGIFDSNTTHSVVHLATGITLVGFALLSRLSTLMLKIFGVIYALIAIVGFVTVGETLFGLIDNSVVDSILHSVLAIVFLWAGFMSGEIAEVTETSSQPQTPI